MFKVPSVKVAIYVSIGPDSMLISLSVRALALGVAVAEIPVDWLPAASMVLRVKVYTTPFVKTGVV